jgi:hypothetical protein
MTFIGLILIVVENQGIVRKKMEKGIMSVRKKRELLDIKLLLSIMS